MPLPSHTRRYAGFSLVEILVSMSILTMLAVLMAGIVKQTSTIWSSTHNKIDQFRAARDGFESMTQRVSQSTLNTYLDYPRDSNGNPVLTSASYIRQSELRFISGPGLTDGYANPAYTHAIFFQAPIGMTDDQPNYGGLQNLLNTWGYFIEYSDDSKARPPFLNTPVKSRFRLMEFMQSAEDMSLYAHTSGTTGYIGYTGHEWYMDALENTAPPVHVIADNVIALVILPRLSPNDLDNGGNPFASSALAPNYLYDTSGIGAAANGGGNAAALNSKNQLPPIVQITMVAIDEPSAIRMRPQVLADLQDRLHSTSGVFCGNAPNNAENLGKYLQRDATNYPDVAQDPSIEAFLINNKINYWIFTTNVSIKGAKWSREQAN